VVTKWHVKTTLAIKLPRPDYQISTGRYIHGVNGTSSWNKLEKISSFVKFKQAIEAIVWHEHFLNVTPSC
jgi:hypothetical protein